MSVPPRFSPVALPLPLLALRPLLAPGLVIPEPARRSQSGGKRGRVVGDPGRTVTASGGPRHVRARGKVLESAPVSGTIVEEEGDDTEQC